MSTQIGRFEILSEIAKSARGGVFKANDPTSNQTVALKTVCLDIPEDQAKEFVERVLAEGEHTRELNSQNLALLYGAGQIEDQFCAAMEYVQGNSIATMLARHEGFSIWDLLDISRQVCAGLDHASSIGVVHHSLEPAKIMVQWDGLVKILGYGISTMSLLDTEPEGVPSPVLHYMSPEQVGGGATDGRSNLFTWGAILYEMVTDQSAFDGTTTDVVFHNILNENPVPPSQINNKIHPAVSELIMKALAKNPDERYQSGREMLDDLEKCKESTGKSATKKSEPARTANAPAGARGAAASKFAGAVAPKPAAAPRAVAAPKPAPPAPVEPVSKVFHVAPPAAETESNAAETADFEPSIAAEQISSAPAHDAHECGGRARRRVDRDPGDLARRCPSEKRDRRDGPVRSDADPRHDPVRRPVEIGDRRHHPKINRVGRQQSRAFGRHIEAQVDIGVTCQPVHERPHVQVVDGAESNHA